MNWNCARLQQRLDEYLEGRLGPAELAAAEAHARACPRCLEWYDARRATAWLASLEPLEAPPGLETRILAMTVAPPAEENLWGLLEGGWRLLLQPRITFGLAATVFFLTLMLNALGVNLSEVRAADLNPASIYRALDRKAHLAYGRGVRFFNDLRLVYEIRSRLEELQPEAEEPPPALSPAPPEPPGPKNEEKNEGPSDGASTYWLLARRPGLPRIPR